VTNTIGQGDTREAGLAKIIRDGGTLHFANRFLKWSGDANVEVNLIAAGKGLWPGSVLLDNQLVAQISSRLDDAPEEEPIKLRQNKNKAFVGDSLRGLGFILEPWETAQLIAKDRKNTDCIYPYLGGHDLNSDSEQKPSRFVICFQDWPLTRAESYPDLLEVLSERVKPERDKVREKHERENWWLFARYRGELRQAIFPLRQILVRSEVSTHHALAFVPKDWICSHKVIVFAFDDNYHFALLQSNLHEIWMRKFTSTLRTDTNYSPTDCFDNFPFPQTPSLEAKKYAECFGKEYLQYRRSIMEERNIGMTAVYNLFHNPNYADADIVRLRELHAEMDCAMLACYDWDDLDPQHNFYQNERGNLRYTNSNETQRNNLVRLIKLN